MPSALYKTGVTETPAPTEIGKPGTTFPVPPSIAKILPSSVTEIISELLSPSKSAVSGVPTKPIPCGSANGNYLPLIQLNYKLRCCFHCLQQCSLCRPVLNQ